MSLLAPYKTFVKQHPSLVLNVQRLLHWFAWNPERFSGSEYAYEAFNAVVGLLGIYHDSILAEGEQDPDLAKWALWLAAVEQVGSKPPLHNNPIVFTLRESPSLGFENQSRDMMAAFIWGPCCTLVVLGDTLPHCNMSFTRVLGSTPVHSMTCHTSHNQSLTAHKHLDQGWVPNTCSR